MVSFGGTIDSTLYARAIRRQMRGLLIVGSTLMLAGVIGLITAQPAKPVTWGAPLFLVLFGSFLWLTPKRAARHALRTSKTLAAPFTGSAADDHFVVESEYGRSELPWSIFHRAIVAPTFVLLFMSAQQSHVISTAFFTSDAEWLQFVALVRDHVPSKTARSRWVLVIWVLVVIVALSIWWFQIRSR